jgi:hypothetical protein
MPTTIASPTQPKETYRGRLHQQFVTLHGSKRVVAASEYFGPPASASGSTSVSTAGCARCILSKAIPVSPSPWTAC